MNTPITGPRPGSDPEPGATGTDIHDFEQRGLDPAEGGDTDDTGPEGEHEKARAAKQRIDEAVTQLPPD
jgi:hypothetical protein